MQQDKPKPDNETEKLRVCLHQRTESVGNLLVELFHYLALFAIGGMTVQAGTFTALEMIDKGKASITNITQAQALH